jgi:TonB-linked SusC/RagA family outer membrane protein
MKQTDCSKRPRVAWLALLFWGAGLSLALAQTTVKGRVVAANDKQPLPGVNILVKGSITGTITDVNGAYTIKVPGPEAVLRFSYVGYEAAEAVVGTQTEVNVELQLDAKALNEVVVVGYGTQRKLETTGAIASVKADQILQTPVVNVAQGLQARVAGVQITQNSAAPGGNISVRIRGTNSINGTSEPLYVIDGIQINNGGGVNDVSPLSTINPNDIESVEVLKDASATAIYGARAANGVVLVTTKRGKAGVSNVSFETYYGVQSITKKINMLNASQFASLENEIFRNPQLYPDPASLGEGTNWQDLVYRPAPIQNYQLTFTGGSEKTQISVAANYFNQEGIVINSGLDRYSLRINLDHRVSKLLKLSTSILTSVTNNRRIQTGSSSIDGPAVTSSIIGATLAAPPLLAPYRDDGTIWPFGDQLNGRYREAANPLGFAEILDRSANRRTLGNLSLDFDLAKGLTYRASFNADLQSTLNDFYSPRSIVNAADLVAGGGVASKGNSNLVDLLHESIFTYSLRLAEVHSLKFTGVFATQVSNFNNNFINARNFPNDATRNEAVQLAVDRTVTSNRNQQRLDSYMGRVNYSFKDKYFLDLTARVDGSSKFGVNNKYGFFPAVAASWRVIEEDFLKNSRVFSDFKLRGSYGATGNANALGPYGSLALVASGGDYPFNHVMASGIAPGGIPNPDLRWERSLQANLGLDISFLNDKFGLVVDVYDKVTKDMLFVKPVPYSSGYSTITGNFAELDNRGIELALNANVLDKALKWDVSANFTINRNKLRRLDGTAEEFRVNNFGVLKVGEPLGIFRTYVFDGIYQNGETILPGADSRVGGTKVRDLNGDSQITVADQAITGDANPRYIFGFTSTWKYQNFDLSVFVTGTQGNQIYNLIRYTFENPLGQRNLYAELANRWSPTNPTNDYIAGFQSGRLPISDRFMEDGSFVRVRNVTLGYNLPRLKWLKNGRVYLSANNLFTFTQYRGYDPEVNTFGGSNTLIGVDNLVYPNSRSFIGGVQLTF